jgi:polysaccharide export outer membrane protein
MKSLPYMFFAAVFLPAVHFGLAQQAGAKPVLSATPAAAAQTTTSAPASAAEGSAQVSPNYIIGPDDSIKIDVHEKPEFSSVLPVRPDGKITLPMIGDVPAAGLTPEQLAAEVTTRDSKLIIDPVVTVTVMQVNSKRVFLIGEVAHVGPLNITPGMTILQAIASAGGLTPYANKKHIYILRGDPTKPQKIPFDYTKAVKKMDMQGISLVPGDTIVVP